MEKSVKQKEAMLNPQVNPLGYAHIQNPDKLKTDLAKEKAQLDRITPPEITSEEMPRIQARKVQLEHALRNGAPTKGIPKMPSQRQMEDNPDYSTDHYRRWEKIWATQTVSDEGHSVPAKDGYGAKFELKDLLYRLNRPYEDTETAESAGSLEYLRDGAAEPLSNMHVPVSFGLSNKAKENYDEVFPDHVPTEGEVKAGLYTEEQRKERLGSSEIRCAGITASGEQCKRMVPNSDQPFCKTHRPV